MISYQLTSTIIALLIAGEILLLIRRDILHTRYAYWWLLVAAIIVIAGVFPQFIDRIAAKFGVSYPPILIVVAGVGMMLVKMLTMDLDRSRQERKVRRIVQRLAILEAEQEKGMRSKE